MKKIILFGTGRNGRAVLEKIMDKCEGDLLFCDNDKSKINTTLSGIQIISFEEMKINLVV